MASWKKIIVSGSDAELNSLYSSGNISSSGSLFLPRAGSTIEIYNTVFEDDGGAFSINTNSTQELNLVSPLIILDNSGAGGNDFVVTGSNVGIGTATPSEKLSVVGNVSASRYIGSDFGTVTGVSNFTGSFSGNGSGLTGLATELTVVDKNGNQQTVDLQTGTLQITAGGALYTETGSAGAGSSVIDIVARDASETEKGVASFNSSNFTVSSGAVSSNNFTISSGNGLTGGGALTLGDSTTLNVVSANNGIVVNADNIQLATASSTFTDGVKAKLNADGVISGSIQVDHDATTNFDANEHIDHSTVSITAGTGLSGGGDITATRTLNVDYGSTAGTAVQGNTTITVNGTTNEIQVTGTAAQALGGAPSYTIGLPNDVTIGNNLTVTGDLTVNGTTTTLDTQNVLVEDRFIFLNHGSGSISPTSEGGIVVEGTTPDQGNAFYYDGDLGRWSLGESIAQDAISVTPSASMATVVDVDGGQSDTATYQKNGNIKVEAGEIWIYA